MAYLGGKSKGFQHIISILNNPVFDNLDYLEPFVGYAHILKKVINKKSYCASDDNVLLITLLKYIQKNTIYPHITLEEYHQLKKNTNKDDQLRKAFAGFTYSYNGKFFGGYTNILHNRNYPNERKNYYKFLFDNETFKKTKITKKDYKKIKPKNKLIYCDPPYENTTKYDGNNGFDNTEFWNVMRLWSVDNYVFISEYNAPKDFKIISTTQKKMSLSGKGASESRTENLYVHESFYLTNIYTKLIS
jgi:DNA adenine methylase